MKNTTLSLLFLFLLASCSKNETTSDDLKDQIDQKDKLTLSSYDLTFFPSTNKVANEFENGKWTKSFKNDILIGEYEYDDKDRMTTYTVYSESTGALQETYTFNYNENDVITSMDLDYKNNFLGITTYSEVLNYDGNIITTTAPKTAIEEYDIIITLNSDSKLEKFEQYEEGDDGDKLVLKADFKYDDNKNCSEVILTALDFNDNQVSNSYKYNYDDKANPLFDYYSKYYLNTILLNSKTNGLGFSLGTSIIRTLGPNNITTTEYPNIFPESAQFFFEYDYNDSGYPIEGRTKNKVTEENSVVADFYY